MVASESIIVRVFGVLALLMLAFIVLPPLFRLNLPGIVVVDSVGVALLVGFVAGAVTRSYWTVVFLPPLAAAVLMVALIIQSGEVSALVRGQYPISTVIMAALEIVFGFVIWMVLALYFLFTPGIVAGMWAGGRLVRRLSP